MPCILVIISATLPGKEVITVLLRWLSKKMEKRQTEFQNCQLTIMGWIYGVDHMLQNAMPKINTRHIRKLM